MEYQGGESNSRPRAYESPALPLSYPGIKLRRKDSMPRRDMSTDSNLLFRLRNVRGKVFFTARERGHEAHSVVLCDRGNPAFLMNVPPAGKPQHCARLDIPLRWKKKELDAFLGHPDLGDALRLIVFENAAADCPKIRELGRHVVMFQPMFHEKQITQGPSISTHRIEENRSCRGGNRQ